MAFGAADVGQADSRVTGGAFDDGSPWFEQAAVFGVLDEEFGGAVFDAAARVLEFGFA